jgi:hypothetical protein
MRAAAFRLSRLESIRSSMQKKNLTAKDAKVAALGDKRLA